VITISEWNIFSVNTERRKKEAFWKLKHRWEGNIKVTFKKMFLLVLGWSDLVQDKGQVAGFCEHGNEYFCCSK
jgi:hypothetical protein